MSLPLPAVPDSGKLTDGNNRISEDRTAINSLDTRLKAIETEIDAATPNAVPGKLVRYSGPLGNGLATIQVGSPPTGSTQAAPKSYVDSSSSGGSSSWNGGTVTGQILLPNAYAAASSYVVAYINGDGRISKGASSGRYKRDIEDADIDQLAKRIQSLRLRRFRWNPDTIEVSPEDADRVQIGLIAEEVQLLFPWLVATDPDGQIESVHYERVALVLIPMIQELIRRVETLESERD